MRMLSLLLVLAGAAVAFADAVPPPPPCPDGKVGVTSHSGGACLDPAPKDCPAGWYPQLGAKCVVQTCSFDANCGEGKACVPVEVCQHEIMQSPHPRYGGPPRKVTVTDGVCSDDLACPDDSECRKAIKVCLPKGTTKPGVWKGQPKPTKKKPAQK